MVQDFPASFQLKDGSHVFVKKVDPGEYEFHLTRLNSEKHNFIWLENSDEIEESYETRFDHWQNEAVDIFKEMLRG